MTLYSCSFKTKKYFLITSILFYSFMCESTLPACMSLHHVYVWMCGCQKILDPLELEIQTDMSCHMTAEIQLWSSSRSASTLKSWFISPTSIQIFINPPSYIKYKILGSFFSDFSEMNHPPVWMTARYLQGSISFKV